MIELTRNPIDTADLLAHSQSPQAGAVLLFVGVTRQYTAGRETAELHYEAYDEMARRELTALATEACERWKLVDCQIVHRLGLIPLGEASVAIVVASAHRKAAFEAGDWLIDTLKQRVPIWKREHWSDGTTDWVHPVEKTTEAIAEEISSANRDTSK